ncbi:uncharacterized protein LOC123538639 isoform X2 [Mercenaria mercenaria]|uniref:uncharacterized protein LOC123538639 isoform X2 n=1 Tax=Mercenaria mercenaria TaxID=6596 RepID=UPI001E1D5D15|nr:uncharacterized protein LOC123538639 isoform X2 [Mercenaria mercenaria]
MIPKFVSIVVLFAIISGCCAQHGWVPITINTYTSRRIMDGAADYIGLRLVRELYAYKKMHGPMYIVTFEGRRPFGMTHTCTARVHEYVIFQTDVLWNNCWPPVYSRY